MKMRIIMIAAACLGLAGCASSGIPTVSEEGGCKSFERPPYALRGRTSYDQKAVDNYTESGVSACGWQRPQPRPAELDAMPVYQRRAAPAPAARPTLYQRAKAKLHRSKTSAVAPKPTTPGPATPVAPAVVERPSPEGAAAPQPATVAPPEKPRDPFDVLMSPPQRTRRIF